MIPTFLSQLHKVDPGFIRDWIITFAALFGLFWMIQNYIRSTKRPAPTKTQISPSPLKVEGVEQPATKAELHAMRDELRRDIDGVKRSLDAERVSQNAETGKLHRRVDEVVEALAEAKGLLTGVKENTDRLLARSMK